MRNKNILFAAVLLTTLLVSTNVYAQCPHIGVTRPPVSAFAEQHGYDYAATCDNPTVTLTAHFFITAQRFQGYNVDTIPFDPPETFNLKSMLRGTSYTPASYNYPANGPVKRLNIPCDDIYDGDSITIDFPFAFFGEVEHGAVVGDNGMLTFNTAAKHLGNCYSPINALPWANRVGCPTATVGSSCGYPKGHDSLMMNGIYAGLTDLHTTDIASYTGSNRGIFKGVSTMADYPCRRICVSWDSVCIYPQGSTQFKNSGMIVLYEGTNIIDIYIRDWKGAGTSSSKGVVGIQNRDGVSHNGIPAFYAAPGYNPVNSEFHNKAWRFTPYGPTVCNVQWFKINSPGNDTRLPYGTQADNIPEYVIQGMNDQGDYDEMYDTICVVKPTEPTRYYVKMLYIGANGYRYDLRDTFYVGIDTANNMDLTTSTPKVCYGNRVDGDINMVNLTYNGRNQSGPRTGGVTWWAIHMNNGVRDTLERGARWYLNSSSLRFSLKRDTSDAADALHNKIDTTWVFCQCTFENGCSNFDSIMLLTYPNYNMPATVAGICDNQAYTWQANGNSYSQPGIYTDTLRTIDGPDSKCDSVVHLDLRVVSTDDTTLYRSDCQDWTWNLNGHVFTETNEGGEDFATVHLTNWAGCDSAVHMLFTLFPVTAQVEASPTDATLDHLNIRIDDFSTGGNDRVFSNSYNSATSHNNPYYFAFPPDEDSVVITMEAFSPSFNGHRCSSIDHVTIHLLKEALWMPNVFTPGEETNRTFGPIGIGLEECEMWIFNRNGAQMFYGKGADAKWDGTYNGTPCPQGTYVYLIRYTNVLMPNGIQQRRGTLTLVR